MLRSKSDVAYSAFIISSQFSMDERWLNGMPRSKLDVSEETKKKDVKSFEATEVKKNWVLDSFLHTKFCVKKKNKKK